MAVIHDGQSLLGDFERADEAAPEGLKERLQLLIGHAFLYGIGDRDSAEDLYQAVLRSGAEPSLRQIAEQGLQQCALPVAPAEAQGEDELLEQRDPNAEQGAQASDLASLWQEPGGDASPGATAGVLSTDPSRVPATSAESLDLSLSQPDNRRPEEPGISPDSDEEGSLGWLTVEPPSAPQDSASQPVMPWLQNGAVASDPLPPTPAELPGARSDLAAVQAQPQPAAEVLSLQQAVASVPSAPAPDQDEAVSPGDPAAAALPFSVEPAPSGPDEAALSPSLPPSPEEVSAADLASLFRQPSGLPQGVPDQGSAAPSDRQQDAGESSALLDAAVSEPEAAAQASPLTSPAELRLVVDVVEEPELIELHQATGEAEQALLLPIDADPQPQELSPPEPDRAESAQPWLQTGVDRRGAEPVLSEPPPELLLRPELDRRGAEPVSEALPLRLVKQEQAPEPVASVAAATTTASAARPVGRGPFSAPPEPVAEEDPELLMGLLKLEMG